jgi:2-octaprenyl-6-methoxyphenol hydroxylase
MREWDVVVIGGGMVGLSFAAALGGAGVAIVVIEPDLATAAVVADFDGRATAIATGSRAVLESSGAWQGMACDAEAILDIRVSDGASPLFLHYDHRELDGGPLGHMVENRIIRCALIERLGALDDAVLMDGRRVTALERDGAAVQVSLDDGTRLRARLAVAADGRNSPTRRNAGITVTEWRYPQTGIVCTVAHERPHDGIAQEHFLPAGPFAILPLTGNRSSIVWTEHAALAPRIMALEADGFAEELGLRFGDYLGALEVTGPRFSYPLGLLHAHGYIKPRLALIGDAAHAIHPIAGQGLNIALRDVAVLAEIVVDALRLGLDPGALVSLERYQRRRRFDNSMMLAVTDGLNRLFSNDLAPLRLARDIGLAAVNNAPPLKRLFMRHAMGLVGELPRLVRGEAL